MSFRFPQFTATPLAQLVPSASHDAVVLMQVWILKFIRQPNIVLTKSHFVDIQCTQDLMRYDPLQRPSLSQTLQSPFFQAASEFASSSSAAAAAVALRENQFEHPSHLTAGLVSDPADPVTHSPPLNDHRPPEVALNSKQPISHTSNPYTTTSYEQGHGSPSPTDDHFSSSGSLAQLGAHLDGEPSENTDFLGEIAGLLKESRQYQKIPAPSSSYDAPSSQSHSDSSTMDYSTGNSTTNATGGHVMDEYLSEDQFGFGAPAANSFSTSNRYVIT